MRRAFELSFANAYCFGGKIIKDRKNTLITVSRLIKQSVAFF